jgi:hypothetical protein
MIPLRLVVDKNIVVSAALKPDGLQRLFFCSQAPGRHDSMSRTPFSLNIGTCCHVQNSRFERAFGSSSST